MPHQIRANKIKSTEDSRSVTLELPKIPFEKEAHIDEALEICTTDPALKQAFVIIPPPQYFDYFFIILFQIKRISQFGASVLKDSVTSIVCEVLSQNLRLTYCPQKAVNDKNSFKDSTLCKEIVLRKLIEKKKEKKRKNEFMFSSYLQPGRPRFNPRRKGQR